ncbi:MAG TPA: hypothetical protein VMS96_09640 [Terriglobales bacterium]|nr:hypothetical protein [Terriglobales bacterium]
MRRISVCPVVGMMFALLAPTLVVAQQQPAKTMSGPPKVLQIVREEVKPGKGPAHQKHEAAWSQAFTKAGYPHNLTISSVTGPSEDWFITGFGSFAEWEKLNKRMDEPAFSNVMETFMPKESEYVSETRMITARYRPELSYRPDFKLGEYRYFSVALVRYKLGHSPDEVGKILAAAREKGNVDAHIVAYQVTSGAPVGSYLYFTALKNLDAWDQPPNQAYLDALKEGKFDEAVERSIQNVEFRLFGFNPRLSYVSEEVASADPAFWHPKAPASKTAAPAKAAPPKKEN